MSNNLPANPDLLSSVANPSAADEAFVDVSLKTFDEAAKPSVPWISTYARLTLEGVSLAECAELLGKTPDALQIMAGTMRFQTLLIQLAKSSNVDAAKKFLSGQAMQCLVTLVSLRDSEKTSPTLRAKIADDMLSRIYGKAAIVHKFNTPDDLGEGSDDPIEVRRRLEAKVKAKLERSF